MLPLFHLLPPLLLNPFLPFLLLLLPTLISSSPDCSQPSYDRCIRLADPLVKQPQLIFPDTPTDIDHVCGTWARFVDCLKSYTDRCFTIQQRNQFNRAVENPIESVHRMCMQPEYREEYLKHAGCIKRTVTEREHCGGQYAQLVEMVGQGDIVGKASLCCSHDRFKQCVIRETGRLCDSGASNGPAATFSQQMIEKALSFLQDQCDNYIPTSGDCTILPTDQILTSDPLPISTLSSEIYPWSTIQNGGGHQPNTKEIRVNAPRFASTGTWPPSSTGAPDAPRGGSTSLGVRTRPASYGRASSWDAPAILQRGDAGSTTPMARPDWATPTSWQPGGVNDERKESSTTWFPAAGNQYGNEVDEPNQQGWSKSKNGGLVVRCEVASLVGLLIALFVV